MRTAKEILECVINGSQSVACPDCGKSYSVAELRLLDESIIVCPCSRNLGDKIPAEKHLEELQAADATLEDYADEYAILMDTLGLKADSIVLDDDACLKDLNGMGDYDKNVQWEDWVKEKLYIKFAWHFEPQDSILQICRRIRQNRSLGFPGLN